MTTVITVHAETAQKTWNKIVSRQFYKHPSFKYVKNNPKLPNVFIYGDSISIGYGQYVMQDLAGKANVYRLYRNGMSSNTVIRGFKYQEAQMRNKTLSDPWTFTWNVITFNVGLHDLKYMNGRKLTRQGGKQVNSIALYKKNLAEICNFFRQTQPQAKLIFVTTTPVPPRSPGRTQGDAVKYNAAALEVLKKYPEIKICDLYKLTLTNHKKWIQRPGDVYYNKLGKKAQAAFVVKAIEKALSN